MNDDKLRYPVGPLPRLNGVLTPNERLRHLQVIEELPSVLNGLVARLSAHDLDLRYREGSWTVRQLVHHIADSHLNAYVRTKLAVTESLPAVKTYEQDRWAELPDCAAPVEASLLLLSGLHERWTLFLRGLSPADYQRAFQHPDWGSVTIDESIVMYSWHCRHHATHIRIALKN